MKQNIRNLTVIGFILNLILATVKIIVGKIGASSSLIADGIHSLSDGVTDIAILLGVKFWEKKADNDHQYGHEKIEFIISFCMGVLLLYVSYEIVIDGIEKINQNESNVPNVICLVVAFISFLLKEALFRWHRWFALKIKSQAFLANAYHHRSDGFSSLVISISLFISIYFSEVKYVDQISAIIVAIFIFKCGIDIIIPAYNALVDKSLDDKICKELHEMILSCDGVLGVHEMRTRVSGSKAYLDVHIQVRDDMTIYEAHKISHQVKSKILNSYPELIDVLIHVEPEND